jgi:hypothetical protein
VKTNQTAGSWIWWEMDSPNDIIYYLVHHNKNTVKDQSTRRVNVNDLQKPQDAVNHPGHYGGGDNVYEAIKVIEAWGLDFCLGNTVKYISRAGKKDKAREIQDLEKAAWYLNHHIQTLKDQK